MEQFSRARSLRCLQKRFSYLRIRAGWRAPSQSPGPRSQNYVLNEGTDFHDIGPDDERFLMLRVSGLGGDAGGGRFILVQNWFEELLERMGN